MAVDKRLRRQHAKARTQAWCALHPLTEAHVLLEGLNLSSRCREAWRALIIGRGCPCDNAAEAILTPEQIRSMRIGRKIFTGPAELEQMASLRATQAFIRAHAEREGDPENLRRRRVVAFLVAVDGLVCDAASALSLCELRYAAHCMLEVSEALREFVNLAKIGAGTGVGEYGAEMYEDLKDVV